jgi:hypothetical protein
VSGRKLVVKDNPGDPSKRAVSLQSRDPLIDTTAATGVDPIADGATLQIYAANGAGDAVCLPLPSAGGSWRASGDPARPRYRYRDALGVNGPCRAASITDGKLLKVTCTAKRSPIGYSLDEPAQGAIAVRFTSGATTWCALFGGTVQRDSGTDPPIAGGRGQFSALDAPAPVDCPEPPAACP